MLRYGLLLLGAMGVLWIGARVVAGGSSTLAAEPASTDSTKIASSAVSGGESSVEVFTWGNMMVLLLLGGGGAYALYLRQQGENTASTAPFRPLGQLALGQSQNLRLVACGEEVLLLGVTDDEVTLLKTYPPDAFEHLESSDETANPLPTSAGRSSEAPGALPQSFANVLSRFAQRDSRS